MTATGHHVQQSQCIKHTAQLCGDLTLVSMCIACLTSHHPLDTCMRKHTLDVHMAPSMSMNSSFMGHQCGDIILTLGRCVCAGDRDLQELHRSHDISLWGESHSTGGVLLWRCVCYCGVCESSWRHCGHPVHSGTRHSCCKAEVFRGRSTKARTS